VVLGWWQTLSSWSSCIHLCLIIYCQLSSQCESPSQWEGYGPPYLCSETSKDLVSPGAKVGIFTISSGGPRCSVLPATFPHHTQQNVPYSCDLTSSPSLSGHSLPATLYSCLGALPFAGTSLPQITSCSHFGLVLVEGHLLRGVVFWPACLEQEPFPPCFSGLSFALVFFILVL
jgi:hypothetical protein